MSRIRTTVRSTFRALSYRNFRLFFAGQSISLIGTWMQQIAMSWLVYRLTGSAFMLGLVGFLSQIPAFLLGPVTGFFVDRRERRGILITAQVFFMVQAFLLAALTLTGVITVWEIMALGVFFGCIAAFEIPARQSFVIDMVEGREHLGNAIALNSLTFNSARMIGPMIAGLLIAAVGEGVCFLLNGISFLAVLASLRAMKIQPSGRPPKKDTRIIEGLREGFAHTFGFPPIRFIILLLAVVSVFGISFMILMPVYAEKILGGGPKTYGSLMASAGIGAIVATLFFAARRDVGRFLGLIPIFSSTFGVGLIVFAVSRSLALSAVLLGVVGFSFMIHMAASNTIIQTIVDDDKRGRVMGFYMMSIIGMAPFGSLIAGTLAKYAGATTALVISGSICFAASILFSTRTPLIKKLIQPILEQHGL